MRLAAVLGVLLAAGTQLGAQVTTPRTKPSDYPVQAPLGDFTIAAEYLVHSIPTPGGVLVTDDYLVVEVAFFGPKPSRLKLSNEDFAMRINGRKDPTGAQSPALVIGTLKTPGWPRATGGAGIGNGSIIFGPGAIPQFPGDPPVRNIPPSPVPPAPSPGGIEKEQQMPVEERVERASLQQGEQKLPSAGLIYFPYSGKTKSLRSLELIYEGSAGKATLKLLP